MSRDTKIAGVVAITIAAFFWVWSYKARVDARLASDRADQAEEVVKIVVSQLRKVDQDLRSQLDKQREEVLEEIGNIPPVPPSEVVVRYRRVVDSVYVDPAMVSVGDSLVSRIEVLEVAVEERDKIIETFPAIIATRDAMWQVRLDRRDDVIQSLELALDLRRDAEEKWRGAASMSFLDKALWTAGGMVVGAITWEVAR